MADIDLEIAGDSSGIAANALKVGVQQTVGLLDEYAHAMWEKQYGHVRWNVGDCHSNGTLKVRFSSILITGKRRSPVMDNSLAVSRTLVDGIATLAREAVTPPYISERGIRRVEAFVNSIEKHEATSFTLGTQGISAEVTKGTGDNLVKLVEIKRTAIGSVEGRLVGINIAKSPRLSIVNHLTKKSVSCLVDEKDMEFAKKALGSRVIAYGTLYKNLNGETIRIGMLRGLDVFDKGSLRRFLADASALPVPVFAKTTDTEEYLRGSRG